MLEEYIKPAMERMTKQQEEIVRTAIGNVLGDFVVLDAAQRCRWTRRVGEAFQILHLDGQPILELHDLELPTQEFKEDRYVFNFTQKYRLLGRAAANTKASTGT